MSVESSPNRLFHFGGSILGVEVAHLIRCDDTILVDVETVELAACRSVDPLIVFMPGYTAITVSIHHLTYPGRAAPTLATLAFQNADTVRCL